MRETERNMRETERNRARTRRKYLLGCTAFAVFAAGGIVAKSYAAGMLSQASNAAVAPVLSSVSSALAQQQQANQVATQAVSQLARVTTELQAMQNMQAVARNAAIAAPDTVADGLNMGGLVPDSGLASSGIAKPVTTWVGAETPTQAVAGGETTVTINQTAAQALLSWNSFNVGKNTTVNFNQQGNTTWTALNKVTASQSPSEILGSIKATGHVYIINPNGIIFGGSSQVNVGSLVASTADLSTTQYFTNGIFSPSAGSGATQSYTPSFNKVGTGASVLVQQGAKITTNVPADVTTGGGIVLLLGTQVQNAGSIVTADGQTELAAGDNFIIRQGYGTNTNSTSTTRGNEVAVQLQQQGSSLQPGGSGLVQNTGFISAPTGDITLAGETVQQNGIALSTTSVAQRGTIHLLSSASDPDSSVTLGSNGYTLIEPDLGNTDTELNGQRSALIAASAAANAARAGSLPKQFDDLSLLDDQQENSRIEIVSGGTVHFTNGSDSSAPGGQLAVSATQRVQADTGAFLDVSGSYAVSLAMAANEISFKVESNDLRDNPQNRLTQDLRNDTVYVDTQQLSLVPATAADSSDRYYTAGGLLEVSGYLANVEHLIGEYTAIGGNIDLTTGAKGAIVAQNGSVFDINGGTLQYQGGELAQSYVVSANGGVYNINTAPAYLSYVGLYNGFTVDHPAWGVSQSYSTLLNAPSEIYESGYTVGRAAGSLTLNSPTTIFDGKIEAATVNGPSQIAADPAGVTDPYLLTQTEIAEPGTLNIETLSDETVSAAATAVIFGDGNAKAPDYDKKIVAKYRGETLLNATSLDKSGLGDIQIVTDDSINVAAPVSVAPGGQVNLYGSSVAIAADVTAPGGSVTAGQVANFTSTPLYLEKNGTSTGNTVVGDNVVISTAGLWTNLLLDPAITFSQAFINGGTVDLGSAKTLKLSKGSLINTSSGGLVNLAGAVSGGVGGNITLAADTPINTIASTKGNLILHGRLDALGYTKGGALTLAAPSFLVTKTAAAPGDDKVVTLNPEFFTQGFSAYNLVSTNDIRVARDTVVNVVEPTYQRTPGAAQVQTGAAAATAFKAELEPLYAPNNSYTAITQRPGASFSAEIISDLAPGSPSVINKVKLSIGDHAAINVDPGQSIALAATGQITIDGTLSAPGGAISAISSFNTDAALAKGPGTVSVWIGSGVKLDASAEAVSFENGAGNRISLAPAGGSITLGSTTSTASVIIRKGAVLEASGARATDRIAASGFGQLDDSAQPTDKAIPVEGAGGSISLASEEGIYNDGALLAAAGGPDAAGGSLSMTLAADDVLNADGQEATPRVFTITQKDQAAQLLPSLTPGSSAGLLIGTAGISAQQIAQGKFGSVTLFAADAFLFKGNVSLSAKQAISLEEGYLTDSSKRGSVTLNAPYVLLSGTTPNTDFNTGAPFVQISGFSARQADGAFTVNASTIDIRNSVRFGGVLAATGDTPAIDLSGFGTIDLNSTGDLQFLAPAATSGNSGSPVTDLITTADLNITAREIYALASQSAQANGNVTVAETAATVIAGLDPTASGANGSFRPDGAIKIRRSPGSTALPPDTLLGGLTFEAARIDQGGVIWQPLGSIQLGSLITAGVGGTSSSTPLTVIGDPKTAVNFLNGSITSVSAAGLNIPFGGTTDGVTYDVNGSPLSFAASAAITAKYGLDSVTNGAGPGTITIAARQTDIKKGAVLDLSGGGNLTGAGFISGAQGSTDVLSTPLLNITGSGVTQPGLSTNPVYAIVAGAQPASAVAYTESGASGATPSLGAEITIPAGVPGLPAGTYTLLPAQYALEPGGYRVEFDGAAALNAASILALPNGSYAVAGFAGLAGTNVRGTLAANLTITPGATVLNYADYFQQSYGDYLTADAATIGSTRPVLPEDAGTLVLNVPNASSVTLTDAGQVSFAAASGGVGGTLQITGPQGSAVSTTDFDIYGAAPTAGLPTGTVSLSAAQIDAFNPTILEIGVAGGGTQGYVQGITLEKGASLKAARVVLTALSGGITLKGGSQISTIGRATLLADSHVEGLLNNNGASVLDVGNGYISYGISTSSETDYGPIDVENGAEIDTAGSIAFSTSAAVQIGAAAQFGGKYVDLAVPEINIGNPGTTLQQGVLLSQAVLQALAAGVPAAGIPSAQIIDLTAFDSLNFYGTAALDLSGSNVQLEINTPAIYGSGGASDTAKIVAGTIVWNGLYTAEAGGGTTLVSAMPGGTVPGGIGTGAGTLDLDAGTIILGYSGNDLPQRDVTVTRLTAGFSKVDLNATSEITANNASTLAVYQSVPDYGNFGTASGGNLNLNTPLLTADNAASIAFTAGGVIQAGTQGRGPASLAGETAGGEIDLAAQSIGITSSVILPSGKLNLQAGSGGITLGAGSLVSLKGAITTNVDQTVYGFGGDLIMDSAGGNVTQNAGSVIDVSAVNNSAGSININTTGVNGNGQAALNGTLNGGVSGALAGNYTSGVFKIATGGVGDFTALNASLDAGGFFQTRDFDIRQGDLTIGNGVQAHNVSVSVDNGSLTVTGLIDASGNGGGSISLAASGDLTLASSAVLDAHGTTLVEDSYGQVIDAENTPEVSLTTGAGLNIDKDTGGSELTIAPGARIDLASADATARGDLELNVPRLNNASSGDADISAPGPVVITGAKTIAVNAFWAYTGLNDPNVQPGQQPDGLITQAYLDQINTSDTQPFMTAAAGNADLAARVAGLAAYPAYALRPGVEIVSATPNGDLTVDGDIDLAGYRYGPGLGAYGAGQPGVLEIRAGGNLNINGSITDGFNQPVPDAGTEFANGWVIYATEPFGQNQIVPASVGAQGVGIAQGSTFPDGTSVNYAVTIMGGSFEAGAVAPTQLTVSGDQTVSIGFIATSAIKDGAKIYAQGVYVPAGTVIHDGATIAAGGSLPFDITVGNANWPAGAPFTFDDGNVTLANDTTLLAGAFIPANSALIFQANDSGLQSGAQGDYVAVRPTVGTSQGQLYGLASLLPAGDPSWSIGLVAGAETTAANPDITQAASALPANEGNITLADTHYGIDTVNGNTVPAYSVIRTGTGSLSLVSGGSINEDSSFGIYTAGAQSAAIPSVYSLQQGDGETGSLLGAGNTGLAALVQNYQANYPTGGGNVLVSAQGDLNGFLATNETDSLNNGIENSDAIGGWLWRQGGPNVPGAWWVEYGSLNLAGVGPDDVQYTGFQGMGTLGGGNLTVNAGGNAGGLDLVVASTGMAGANGGPAQGGGALNVDIGGALNYGAAGSPTTLADDEGGVISDLRGNTVLRAGSIGTILPQYGILNGNDPRFLSPFESETANFSNGIELAPGDGTVTADTRGDIVIDYADNPGTVTNTVNYPAIPGLLSAGSAVADHSDFSLWTASTAIGLFSAGGDVNPANAGGGEAGQSSSGNDNQQEFYPASLLVTSQNGNIYTGFTTLELMPSTAGQLQLLAAQSIIGEDSIISMSGAPLSTVATPFNPGYQLFEQDDGQFLASNYAAQTTGSPLDFGVDIPTGALHANDTQPARIYAANGDILNISFGQFTQPSTSQPSETVIAAKPFDIYAGRDIVDSGSINSPNIFLNLSSSDISQITAGRDIIASSFDIAGPGQLVVQAGRNYEAFGDSVIDSIGAVFDIDPAKRNNGAGVALIAGSGGAGPDYAGFANTFLNDDTSLGLSDDATILAGDDAALALWLQQNYGYTGSAAGAYAYFQTLPSVQQDVFLRTEYFKLLDASGLEFNNPASVHSKSYILGQDAVAALFPAKAADGQPITYAGNITMSGESGIHTDFGGNIETLTPGGETIVGVEGPTPPGSAGIITQGNGDIDMYALGSVELGESRVLTTFGGNIVIWSAQGDINAGRGSKTTIVFTPLQRVYNNYGDVFLSPSVPSSGAGIATLNPIPSVLPGNIDLVAPLGTVDAGEAGIRGSGNLNIAALHVLNAANIQVQGTSSGVPVASAVNVGGLTSAANAAGAAAQAAQSTAAKPQAAPMPSVWIVEILGYGGSDGGLPAPEKKKKKKKTTQI